MDVLLNTPLLQPITATTPLAAVLNRLLVALAPAAALINPAYPSQARECLQNATNGAHLYHQIVTKTISRLEQGKDFKNFWQYIRFNRSRPSLAHPIVEESTVLALAMRGAELTTAAQVRKYPEYLYTHHEKLIAQGGPFAEDCALLMALFAGGTRAAQEMENPLNEANRTTDALALLRCVLAADAEGVRACIAAIDLRDGAEPWPWVRRNRRKLLQALVA